MGDPLGEWKLQKPRSQGVRLHTPAVAVVLLMMVWPFGFCQKPMVSAPVCTGPQTVTVFCAVWPV